MKYKISKNKQFSNETEPSTQSQVPGAKFNNPPVVGQVLTI